MAEALLTIKLHTPVSSSSRVARPHLFRRLDDGLRPGARLTLVSAPAGFGKTTLLSDWAASLPPATRTGWLSLDEADNDPSRFLAYLAAAVGGIQAQLASELPDLSSSPLPTSPTQRLILLLNQVAEFLTEPSANPGRRLVLVLDDYHLITNQTIHDGVAFLIDHLPENAHVAIASRADPPLGLPRLRGRGQLLELRQRDLALSADEAHSYLRQVMALDLPPDEVAALATRTEGWIAGLQMAGLSLQGSRDTAAFVCAFAGSDHYIFDYLMEEVLQRQSERVQSFLLRTSILERMTGPLCDAMLPADDSTLLLEQLEHANLFIVPMDTRREWYRTHRLFGDLLHQHLVLSQRDQVLGLHARASLWYEEQGMLADAIHHALQGQDWERAAHLVERAAEPALMRGEFATFLGWLEALPEQATHALPRLCLYHIWGLLMAGRPLTEVESHLRDAGAREAGGAYEGAVTALRAVLAVMRGDAPEAREQAQRARRLLPEEDLFFRGLVVRSLGIALLYRGDAVGAQPLFEEDARISLQTGDSTGRLAATRLWAASLMTRGHLRQAREVLDAAEPLLPRAPGTLQPAAAKLLAVQADLLRECNELEEAARLCEKAIAHAQAMLDLYGLGAHLVLARIRQAQGDADASRTAIQEALRLALKYDVTELDDALVYAYRARLFLAGGDVEAAAAWSRDCGLDAKLQAGELAADLAQPSLPYYVREIEYTSLARVYLAQGKGEQALAVLRPLLATAERLGRTGSVVEILALEALALQAQGQATPALATLSRALSLAEPEGYVRVFADEGAPMARLLGLAVGQGIRPAYAARLLAVLGAPLPEREWVTPTRLTEPLSERELEVLRLLAAGLSNPEIANELVISENTVRSHCKSIFGKLNVHKRWEAAHRAQELGLL